MKPRSLFNAVFGVQAALLVCVALLTVLLYRQLERLNESRDAEFESYVLADELRQSSDDLSRMARTFAVTGDPAYAERYQAILDIRRGTRGRPVASERVYWDLVTAAQPEPRPAGSAISLHERMIGAGFTDAELAKLGEAEKQSDKLVKTELGAMSAAKGLFDDGTGQLTVHGAPDRELALRLLSDDAYHAAKAAIMTPIDDFSVMFRTRTAGASAAHRARSQVLLAWLLSLVVATIAFATLSFTALRRQIARRLEVQGERARVDARFRELVANIEEVVLSTDRDGRIEFTSPSVKRLYGLDPEAIVGRSFVDFVHPDDRASVEASFQRTLAGATDPFEFRALDKDGRTRHLRSSLHVRLEDGRPAGVDGVTIDFTELRQAQQAREASEAVLRTAFAVMPAAMAINDVEDEFRFLDFNDAFEQITGYSRADAIGVTPGALGLVDEAYRPEIRRRVQAEGTIRSFEHVLHRKDGTTRTGSLNFAMFTAGGTRYAVTLTLDVTEQKKAERELQQRLAFETLLADLASRFLDVDDDKLAEAIVYAQQRTCEVFDLDRSTIAEPRDDAGDPLEVTHVYPSALQTARADLDPKAHFPWMLERASATGKSLYVADTEALPPEAAADRASCQRLGITSLLSVPWCAEDGTLRGVIGFASVRARSLSAMEILQLETLSQMMLVVLVRARERRATARGQERNRLLTELLDEAPAGIIVVDARGAVLYANRHGSAMHGFTPEEFARLTVRDFSPPGAGAAGLERVQRVLERGEESFTVWHVRKDGTLFHVHLRARRTQWGDQTASLSVQTDLTEREEAEANIRKLSQAVEQSPESIVIANLDHRIEYVNEAFLRSTGLTRDEVVGQELAGLPSNRAPAQVHAAIREALGRGEAWNGELASAHRDGRAYVEHAIFSPLRSPDGDVTHYLAIKQDITATKQMAEELDRHRRHLEDLVRQRTEELRNARDAADAANRAKSRFLANMSHEIRTPMNAVLGFAQLLLRDPAATTEQRRHIETINRAGDHLLTLIDGILQLAKVESGHDSAVESAFDLWLLADDIEHLFRPRAIDKGLTFEVARDASVPRFLRADEGKLRQVVSNLLGNAVKFTTRGGVVLRLVARSQRLAVEVEDTGAGIAPEELGRLFQVFEQTETGRASRQGSGLGLAISRQLVRLMGGDITVQSRPGEGSVFRFEVPFGTASDGEVASRALPPRISRLAPGQSGLRILVADDVEDNRTLLLGLLSSVGFETRPAADGEQAIREFEAWRPQLIMMDLRMPVIDGIEAIRRIRATAGGDAVKIMCVTASAFDEDEQLARDAGADDFLKKPVRETLLLDRIASFLDVRFEDAPEDARAKPEPAHALTVEEVARLPETLRQRLREATRRADLDGMLAVAEEVRTHDAGVATALRDLAERYAYRRILELLEGA